MSKHQASIELLTVHRENLLATRTFEEYRDAHVAYVDMLIERYRADAAGSEIKIEYRIVHPPEQQPEAP